MHDRMVIQLAVTDVFTCREITVCGLVGDSEASSTFRRFTLNSADLSANGHRLRLVLPIGLLHWSSAFHC